MRRLWNTSDPQKLSQGGELPFLGLTIQRSPSGLFLHQVQYAELLLEEHASHIPKRARTTTGEAESFKEEQNPSQPPDQNNPEHLEWIKIGIMGSHSGFLPVRRSVMCSIIGITGIVQGSQEAQG